MAVHFHQVLNRSPQYLLAGLIQKAVAPQGSLSLVDIYGKSSLNVLKHC